MTTNQDLLLGFPTLCGPTSRLNLRCHTKEVCRVEISTSARPGLCLARMAVREAGGRAVQAGRLCCKRCRTGRPHRFQPDQWLGTGVLPAQPFLDADNTDGLSTLSGPGGIALSLVVTVPAAPSQPFGPIGSPTGLVANGNSDFVISKNGKSGAAAFIFDIEDGTISGWNPSVDPTHAVIAVDNSGSKAFYTGLAMASDSSGHNFIYAADPTNNKVDIYDGSFGLVKSFTDPGIPAGSTPF
jgi:hypothetical protein